MIYSLPEKVAKSQECCSICHIIHETKSYSTNGLDKKPLINFSLHKTSQIRELQNFYEGQFLKEILNLN